MCVRAFRVCSSTHHPSPVPTASIGPNLSHSMAYVCSPQPHPADSFAVVVKCIFVPSSVRCFFRIRQWVDVSNDRFCYLYRITGKWYSLAIFVCFLSLTPIFCSLLALWCDACVPILFACLPGSHDIASPPHPINLLLVYLVGLASRSACLSLFWSSLVLVMP